MRILYAATGDIALDLLSALHEEGLVGAVLTAPDAPGKRGKGLIPPPVKVRAEELGLPVLPRHIEGFDIAQLSGKYTVASLIVFRDGNPSNKEYRHFSMKSLDGRIDDFQSMREAVGRRYQRLVNEGSELPDLLMVDGGKGQVSAALDALSSIGLDFPVVGLAKEHEEIVFPGDRPSLLLDHSDPRKLRSRSWNRSKASDLSVLGASCRPMALSRLYYPFPPRSWRAERRYRFRLPSGCFIS